MPTRPEPKEIFLHSTYYLSGGDLYIIIQNIVFRIHRYFFERDSPWFKEWFDTSNSTPSQPIGKSLSTTFILDDIQPDKFANFLWVFYNPTHSLYNTKSCRQWFRILKVAKLYSFQSVTELVFQELSNLVDNMDTKSITSQTSQSTEYYTTSEGALPNLQYPLLNASPTWITPTEWIVMGFCTSSNMRLVATLVLKIKNEVRDFMAKPGVMLWTGYTFSLALFLSHGLHKACLMLHFLSHASLLFPWGFASFP